MDFSIIVCTIVVALCCVGVVHVLARSVEVSSKQNRDFLAHAIDKITTERHWQAQNSVEARMVDQMTGSSASQAEIIRDLSDKVLAFTQEGRDHMRNMQEIQAMRAQLEELRHLNSGLVARNRGEAEGAPVTPPIRHEDGRSVARFDAEGP